MVKVEVVQSMGRAASFHLAKLSSHAVASKQSSTATL